MISISNFHFVASRILTLLAFAFITIQTSGQFAPPAYEIKNDTTRTQDLPDTFVIYLADSSGNMTWEDALSALQQGKMKPWKTDLKKSALNKGEYWYYFRLANKTGKDIEVGFDAYSNIADYHVIRPDKKHEVYTTGDQVSWKKKKEFRYSNVAPVPISKGDTIEVLYRAVIGNSRFVQSFKIAFVNPDRFARKYLADNEFNLVWKQEQTVALYSGIYLITALIYFVFFFLVRERVFLYFAFFLLFLSLGSTPYSTDLQRNYPEFTFILNGMFGLISFVFFLHFIRQYLNIRKHLPRWDKFLIAFSLVFLVIGSADVISSGNDESPILFVFLGLFIVFLIATFFLLKKRQEREKRFLLYAVLPFFLVFPVLLVFILWIVFTGDQETLLNNNIFRWLLNSLSTLMDLTFIWMTISFSRLLFRRFTELRQKISEQQIEKEQILLEKEQERLRLIEKQKEDLEIQVTERTAELKTSLENLKATQAQLIQSEKMASLGEMTAGIAHEIQNPLNFVNNFAEVNGEILQELKDEIGKMVPDAATRENLEALILDLSSNQEKIKSHGKRADSIVKNMLQHSRTGTSQKEDTDLNALIDEYVKLSFHGMRAKDKSFNSDFHVDLDPAIAKVPILTQDFGRVILNLANNAFYAVTEKKKAEEDHKPLVQVKTSLNNATIRIIISDNGNGISDKIKDKIFQPFFTTKPSGEGTGLGLSISYDIITKGHGGKMWVESKEGEGTSFIIEIPA